MNDHDGVIRDLTNLRDDFIAAPDEETQAWAETLDDALALLKEQEPRSGHWTVLDSCSNAGVYCSECQTKVFDHYPMKKKLSRFCPHCGAKMEECE